MEISIIFKIAALGIVITVLGQVLKHSGREEMTFLLSLAGLVIVLFWIVPYISELFKAMQDMFSLYNVEDWDNRNCGSIFCSAFKA